MAISADCLATTISDLMIVVDADGTHFTAQHTLFTDEELVVITLPQDRTTLNVEFGGPNSRVFARAHEQNPNRQSLSSGTVFSRFRHRFPDVDQNAETHSKIIRASAAGVQITLANTEKLSYSVTWVLPKSVELMSVSPDTSDNNTEIGQWSSQANVLTFRQEGNFPRNLMIEYRVHETLPSTTTPPDDDCDNYAASDDCSPDLDADGVPDFRDICLSLPTDTAIGANPDTDEQRADLTSLNRLLLKQSGAQAGTADPLGCGQMPVIVLADIEFENGKAYLSAKVRQVLDRVAIAVQRSEGQLFEVAAHTDNAGQAGQNQRLSENRANAIRHYLMLRGVGPNQLQARGYGETSPKHDNKLASGRAANRRVELRRLNQEAVRQ